MFNHDHGVHRSVTVLCVSERYMQSMACISANILLRTHKHKIASSRMFSFCSRPDRHILANLKVPVSKPPGIIGALKSASCTMSLVIVLHDILMLTFTQVPILNNCGRVGV